MKFLEGKVAVVTGGTRGIGRAIAERLLAEGARVAICGRTRETVERAVAEMDRAYPGCVMGEAADVSEPEQVERLFRALDEKAGPLDVLVNNAGAGVFRSAAELSVEDWRRTIALNLNGPFYCSREALRRFR